MFSSLFSGSSGVGSDPAEWMRSVLSGRKSQSGARVNEVSSMQLPAVWACVRVLAESVAQTPIHIYERVGADRRVTALNHHLYQMLHLRPNHEMSAATFKETLMVHITLWGNGYCEIEYNEFGEPVALWPLMPNETWKYRDPQSGEIKYTTIIPHGKDNRRAVTLPSYRVLHIPGISMNGLTGISVIRAHIESIGLGKGAQEFGSRFYSNGLNTGGVVTHPGELSDKAYARLKSDLEAKNSGLSNANRMMLLEEGMTYQKIGIPPDDAQFLETRKYQNQEVARIFRVPPHMIQDLEKATFSNIEHQSIDFWKYTMMPWFTKWEQSINNQLIFGEYRTRYYSEFDPNSLMRGDSAARASYYNTMLQNGSFSHNEVRRKENMDPIEHGDVHFVPLNMIPLDQAVGGTANDTDSENEEPDQKEERMRPLTEVRSLPQHEQRARIYQIRRAQSRKRIKQNYESRIRIAAQRTVNFEARALRKKISDLATDRSTESFEGWLNNFYRNEMPDYLQEQFGSVFSRMGQEIKRAAEKEIGRDADDGQVQEFIRKYIASFIARYTSSSKGQILALLRTPAEDVEDDDMDELLLDRIDEWQDKRADKVAMNESVKLGSAVAKTVFAIAGIVLIRWLAFGSQTCNLCSELDGQTIGVQEKFVNKGQEVGDMTDYQGTGHPPLHQGCECEIVAEE